MGGVAAYEMARQLAAGGETVEVLALIDTLTPELLGGEPDPGATAMVAVFAGGLAWGYGLEVPDVDFSGLDEDGALALVLDLGREAGLLPPSTELAELRRLFDRFRANHHALYAYEPDPYPGEIILFRAAERMREEADPTLGWSGLAKGGLRIWDMPGNHYTLLREEVGALAARFQAVLGQPLEKHGDLPYVIRMKENVMATSERRAKSAQRELKKERIELRVASSAKLVIQRAMAVSGLTAGDLAYEGARRVLADHERMVLAGADRDAFLEAVLNPPEPTDKLVAALKRHREVLG
jgi:thioesterase domain-containing protein/uncharacterized protein (DUF1778 family)